MRYILGVLLVLCALAVAGIFLFRAADPAGQRVAMADVAASDAGVIVAMGDSLTEGLGVPESEAYPSRLEAMLRSKGYNFRVINAGISGETSSGALSRVAWVMKLNPDIVVLATGANDGLRGLDPELLAANLDRIVTQLEGQGVVVVLAGMKALRNMGLDYMRRFEQVYQRVAAEHDLIFMPFLLNEIALDVRYTLADGLHPNSEGYRVMTENIYPFVVQSIARWLP